MSSNVFNTDLFKSVSNYDTIARQVTQICDRVGFSGLENVKLPWSQAVAFAGLSKTELKELPGSYSNDQLVSVIASHSKLYKYLEQWTLYKLEAWMTDSSSFNVFIKRLKYVLQKMQDESSRINRVWYSSIQGE